MDFKELKKKAEKELEQLIEEKRERIRQLHFTIASGKVKNVKEIRTLRKDIAKMLTILNNKEKEENQEKKESSGKEKSKKDK